MNAKTFHISLQGASHIKKNKECQDASRSYCDDKIAYAIVCDGHGGDDYVRSATGSKLACSAAEKSIKYFLENIGKDEFLRNPEKLLHTLEASIINFWNQLIDEHYEKNPFSEMELSGISEKAKKRYLQEKQVESAYGTTLIAVAMTHEYWFGIHIGDGKCVAINPQGKFVQPIPWDKKCFLNATTSICDSNALGSFRHFYSEKLPVAVFVGSDGIDDCFSNNEQLHNLYKTILYSFGTTEFKEALDGLKDYLPRLSAKGSGDDVSIAAVLDFDLVPQLDVVKQFDREKEKARVEENARKEAEKNEAEKRRVEQEHESFRQKNNFSNKVMVQPKYCMACGARLVGLSKYCGECGVRIQPMMGTVNKRPEIDNKVIAGDDSQNVVLPSVSGNIVEDEHETGVKQEYRCETNVEPEYSCETEVKPEDSSETEVRPEYSCETEVKPEDNCETEVRLEDNCETEVKQEDTYETEIEREDICGTEMMREDNCETQVKQEEHCEADNENLIPGIALVKDHDDIQETDSDET